MSGKNPFSRAIKAKTDESADEVSQIAGSGRRNLKQASAESDGGHADDTPSEVEDNADDAAAVGAELGVGSLGFVSAKDRVSGEVDDSSGDPPPAIDTAPEDRIADGQLPAFHIDGVSTQDALNAASGANNTDVSDLTGFNPRSFVEDAKADRNPLNDPQIAASMALIDEASASTTDKLSVAADDTGLATAAAAGALGGAAVGSVAGATVGIVGAGAAGAAAATMGVATAGGAVVGAGTYLANDATGGALGDVIMKNIAVVPVVGPAVQLAAGAANTVGEIAVAASDVSAGAATPSEAVANVVSATSGPPSTGATGSTKGGGAKLVDPDTGSGPPSEAEIAFAQAMKQQLGIRRIPGDIDPGEGDGTQSSGPVNERLATGIVDTKSNESLVGNPSDPDTRNAPASLGQGSPGFGGGRQGTDIDPLDGSAFTGRTRTEGPEDVDFGVGSEPLVGFDDDEAEEEEDSDDEDDDEEGEG